MFGKFSGIRRRFRRVMRKGSLLRKASHLLLALAMALSSLPLSLMDPRLAFAAAGISLSPTFGPPGATVTVTGSGFTGAEGTAVGITFDGITMVTNPASPTLTGGAFSVTFVAPSGAGGGTHTVQAIAATELPTATFRVITLGLNPASGGVGTSVGLSSNGWDRTEEITFLFDTNPITTSPATVTTVCCYGFSNVLIQIPSGSIAGAHTIKATGAQSGLSTTATFTVVSTFITLSPVLAGDGRLVTVTGSGYNSGDVITLRFDGNIITTDPEGPTVDAGGAFTAKFLMPDVSPNQGHTISATGSPSGKVASAFLRVPDTFIRVSPIKVGPGTSVEIGGQGFAGGETLSLTLDNNPITPSPSTVTTDGSGNFGQVLFVIPSGTTAGTHIIKAIGATSGATGDFPVTVVTTFINLSPSEGGANRPVTITGSGFTAGDAITLRFDGSVLGATPDPPIVATDGTFTAKFFVPSVSVNTSHTVSATGSPSGKVATAFFRTPGSFIYLSPQAGGPGASPGTSIGLFGEGFSANETVTFKFDSASLPTSPGTVVADRCCSYGFSNSMFTIPVAATAGPHTVTATGVTSGRTATFPIEVVSTFITLTPNEGGTGTVITVAGKGYTAGDTISVRFDGAIQSTVPDVVTADGAGTFTAEITAPGVGLNTSHTVSATGSPSGVVGSAFFRTPPTFINISPTNGAANTSIGVSGSGYAANESITFALDGVSLTTTPGTVAADSGGNFARVIFVIPGGTTLGSHVVEAKGVTSGNIGRFNLQVVSTAISIRPLEGDDGTEVLVTGVGFGSGESVTVRFDGSVVATATADTAAATAGQFSTRFNVPCCPGRNTGHLITATGAASGKVASSFWRTPDVTLVLTPPRGGPGAGVIVNGAGFAGGGCCWSGETISITFDGVAVATSPSPLASNICCEFSFPSAQFVVPAGAAPGPHTVRATGASSGNVSTAIFTAELPSIAVDPPTSGAGTVVTITGAGFAASQTIIVRFDGNPIPTTPTTITSSASGAFTATFGVPSTSANSLHIASAADSSGNTARTSFFVTTAATRVVTLTPANGSPGAVVTIKGTGFSSADTSVNVSFGGTAVTTTPSPLPVSGGAFEGTFVVPSLNNGNQTVTATGSPGNDSASATFRIARVGLSPTSGGPGTSVELFTFGAGCNFDNGESVSFTFDGTPATPLVTLPSSVTVDSCGNFSRALFLAPAGATVGPHTIKATGSTSGASATATFTVGSTFITLNPVQGGTLQPVTVTGVGFDANESVAIRFDGTVHTTVQASGTGGFTAIIRVPNVSLNTAHTVSATGSLSNKTAEARLVTTGTTINTISTFTGGPGTSVGVQGSGFSPNETITFTFDGNPLTTVPDPVRAEVCCWGFTNVLFTIPAGTAAGTHVIEAKGASSGNRASFPIEVVSNFITVTPPKGGDNLPSTLNGQGFGASENVTVRFDSGVIANFNANATGAATGVFRVPDVNPNTAHTVTATGDVSGKSASAFFMTPGTFFDAFPFSGGVGTSVGVAGQGFGANEVINFKFDSSALTTEPAPVTADGSGNFGRLWLFKVPAGALAGPATITATGATSGRTAEFPFNVVATSIVINPIRGGDSQPVSVTGTGFGANDTVTIRFDGGDVATATASATGAFSATFRVPDVSFNTFHTVSATGSPSGATASAGFVAPGANLVTISTFSGGPGTSVGLAGFGFSPNENIVFTFDGNPLPTIPDPAKADVCCWGFNNVQFIIPTGAAAGAHIIEARGVSSGVRASFPIEVVANFITLTPSRGGDSLPITVNGQGFGPNENATLRFAGSVLATFATDGTGAVTGAFRVPDVSVNTAHTVSLTGSPSGKSAAAFFMAPGAFFDVFPFSGGPGTSVGVAGTGFNASETVTFTFDGAPLPTEPEVLTVDGSGNFGRLWLFRVPAGATLGPHTVRAKGAASARVADFPFEVVATSISITPDRGWQSLPVTVNGVGYDPGEIVLVKFDGSNIATTPAAVTVAANGTFSARFITGSLSLNTFHTVSALGNTSDKTASAGFVVPNPAMIVSPTSAPAGATVTITDSKNWAFGHTIVFTFAGNPITTSPSSVGTTGSCCWGFINVSFTVPAGTAPGVYKLVARSVNDGTTATYDFLVTPTGVTTSIALSPPSGPAGSTVNVTGVNFHQTDTMATITFDGTAVTTAPPTVAISNGGLSASFAVPANAQAGNHTVCAAGSPAGDRSCAVFSVITAFITLSPSAGPPGAKVTVSGGNFLAVNSTASISFDNAAVATTPAIVAVSNGSFSGAFNVPSSTTSGNHVVRATGAPGNDSAVATFNVTQESLTAAFTGKVALEVMGAAGDPRWGSYALKVDIFPAGGTTATTVFTSTDNTGHFTAIAALTAGAYDVEVKGHHTLSNKVMGVSLPQAAGATPIDFGALITGDLSNDNGIFGGDYSILVTNFGKSGPRTVGQQTLSARPALGPVNFHLSGLPDRVRVGDVFMVDVQASAGEGALDSVDLFLKFNPALLQAVDAAAAPVETVTPGTGLPVTLNSWIDNKAGQAALSAGRAPLASPLAGQFTAATLYFKALAAAPVTEIAIDLASDATSAAHYRGRPVLGSVSYNSFAIVNGPIPAAPFNSSGDAGQAPGGAREAVLPRAQRTWEESEE